MAWAIHTQVHPAEEIADAIDSTEPRTHVSKDQLAQIREAKQAAKDLIAGGTLGSSETNYLVALDGHAGDGSVDSISIRIQAVDLPKPDLSGIAEFTVPPKEIETDTQDQ